jgi:hypothetical protein
MIRNGNESKTSREIILSSDNFFGTLILIMLRIGAGPFSKFENSSDL